LQVISFSALYTKITGHLESWDKVNRNKKLCQSFTIERDCYNLKDVDIRKYT